jgi:anti-sigma regulatory factor (Ser/Thr protein kinase)
MGNKFIAVEHRIGADAFAVPHDAPRAPFVELKQSLPSQLDAVTPFLTRLMRLIMSFTGDDPAQADLQVALREALLNAVIHGNKIDPEKRV